ncbi:UNVERIFIED_CONTAM: hypothetical protein FKN15_054071 [Acipenser sinensis]
MKVVTVQFFNEAVSDYDITTWLNRYGRALSERRKITDEDGVWTGARKWLVHLNVDPSDIGGVRHIPNSRVLGSNRGLVFYNGMPKLCKKCGELGHLAAACTVVKCRNCSAPTRLATAEKRGSAMCGKGHLFKDCPSSYANMARASKANTNKPRPEHEERENKRSVRITTNNIKNPDSCITNSTRDMSRFTRMSDSHSISSPESEHEAVREPRPSRALSVDVTK